MQEKTRERIVAGADQLPTEPDEARLLQMLLDHYESGDSQHFYLGRDEKLVTKLAELLGHTSFDWSQMTAFSYTNVSNFTVEKDNPGWSGVGSLSQMFARLGDIGMMEEFVNDYTVRVAIKLDDETTIIYEHSSYEQPGICDDCSKLEEYDSILGPSRFYSCEHGEYTFESSYSAAIFKDISKEELDQAFAWGV